MLAGWFKKVGPDTFNELFIKVILYNIAGPIIFNHWIVNYPFCCTPKSSVLVGATDVNVGVQPYFCNIVWCCLVAWCKILLPWQLWLKTRKINYIWVCDDSSCHICWNGDVMEKYKSIIHCIIVLLRKQLQIDIFQTR